MSEEEMLAVFNKVRELVKDMPATPLAHLGITLLDVSLARGADQEAVQGHFTDALANHARYLKEDRQKSN